MNYKVLKVIFLSLMICIGCQEEFLDKKPDKALLVPQNLKDFRALLDNTFIMNSSPGIHIIGDGDFVISDEALKSLPSPYIRNGYVWKEDLYEGEAHITDWSIPYQQIFYSNVVLEGLNKYERSSSNAVEYDNVKGSALFYRALGHFLIAQVFAPSYDEDTATEDLGIPIRLTSDISQTSSRGTLFSTYEQIIKDLVEAERLLSIKSKVKSQPSKHATYALMSRLYLNMRNYEMAEFYADRCLEIDNRLIDFNSLDPSANIPFPDLFLTGNAEVVYYFAIRSNRFLSSSLTSVAPELYRSYKEGDLRKNIFFRNRNNGVFTFKGSYNGLSTINGVFFGGIANDELYLVKAECAARRGEVEKALTYVNNLLKMRWSSSHDFPEFLTNSLDEALAFILDERRKELVGRGIRWHDLKRLNKEEKWKTTLKRDFEGVQYLLEPNSLRYVLPIPPEEISGSGIEQNNR